MTFESFVDIYKDDEPTRKLALLVDTMELLGNNRVNRAEAEMRKNHDDAEYYSRECGHMMKRAEWLYEELRKVLEDKSRYAYV